MDKAAYKKQWALENRERVRANFKKWYQENGKKRYQKRKRIILENNKKWRQSEKGKVYAKGRMQREPEKMKARWCVSWAIQTGKLVRQPCEKCGKPKAHAHHDDYSKPLEVRWLCLKHHTEFHRAK